MAELRLGFLGMGVVGSGTLAALQGEREAIARRVGADLLPVRVAVRNPDRQRPVDLSGLEVCTDSVAVATADDVDIVIEAIGGVGEARDAVTAALRAGKPVVTANKELIAKHGRELFELADQQRVDLAFEGSVGGGIPIIAPLGHGLTANRVKGIVGIINGTTNYILSAMTRTGQPFDELLAEAQAEGYAEADPSSDIDGHDAAYKLTILAMLAFDTAVSEEQVHREGISGITPEDVNLAKYLGYSFKLLAVAADHGDRLELRVSPCLVPVGHPLASVNGVFNAIYIEAEPVGQVMFYGRGAGADPTGSAVAGDVIGVARNMLRGGHRSYPLRSTGQRRVASVDELIASYYIRMRVADQVGVLAELAGVLGRHGVSIAQVLQTPQDQVNRPGYAELVWITHTTSEASIQTSLAEIRASSRVDEICNVFRCFGVDA